MKFQAYRSTPSRIPGAMKGVGLAGGGRTVVLLADNIFGRSLKGCVDTFGKQSAGARVVLSREKDREHLRHLGVAHLNGSKRIERIVEKPKDPPSEFAVTGAYFYDETVWGVLASLKPSGRGELEITDVNNWYVERGLMEYDILEGFWGDAGESIEAYYAVNDHVRKHGANRES